MCYSINSTIAQLFPKEMVVQLATLEMAVMDLNSGDELQTQFTVIASTKLF